MFRLLQTLFATLKDAALPALQAALPRLVRAVDASAAKGGELRDAALDTFGVVAACVPQFLHAHLEGILDTLVKLEGLVVAEVDEGTERRRGTASSVTFAGDETPIEFLLRPSTLVMPI